MLKIEKRILQHIEKNITGYFLLIVSIVGLLIRLIGIPYVSGDMKYFLLPWYEEAMRLGGINSIGYEIGNYNIPYQFFISILTYIPVEPIVGYKSLSIFFDFILALAMGLLVTHFIDENKIKYFTYVYVIILFLPTIFLNSGFWGQADSIYTTFIIISLILFKREWFNLSFLILGFAFGFKLQTILIFPLYLYYYFINKKFSIFNIILFTSLGMYLLSMPGFMYGREFLDPIKVYLGQAKDPYIWAGFPSMWSLLTPTYEETYVQLIKYISILLCAIVLFTGIYFLMKNKIEIGTNTTFILLATWIVYTNLVFLVNMHDRYGYLLDLLFVVMLFAYRKLAIFCIIPFIIGMISYGNYLFLNQYMPEYAFRILAVCYLINYFFFTNQIINYIIKNKKN